MEVRVQPVQLLDAQGNLRSHPDYPLDVTPELCRTLYRHMKLARRLDEEALALQRQGELGLWLQSSGQEAAQVGSISALRPTDYVFPSYREHAAAMVRGITPTELLVQWRGNQHSGWSAKRYNFHICTLVLAAQLPHAVGYAMGAQRDGTDEVVTAYFGDGASSEGDASEAFNWAATTAAPVLFFCQNNQWAISTPTHRQMRTPLHQRAAGFGLASHLVDGNDVLAVHAVTQHAAETVRSGGGPAFIEAMTYRIAGHSTSDDPGRYRSAGEVEDWKSRDPLHRLELLLDARGWMDADFRDSLDRECAALAAETRRSCLELQTPDMTRWFDHVVAEPGPHLHQQRDRYQELLSSFLD
ncbi:thiamine pyrophosphate-dependent dehydrogenase E1 component subunit alpha [Rhodococcus aetherivorans]|uniref:thiamine pyrophosphate-dependent dehydrogenase E1 component subunit alpha n=1 Tax=Rhodococcus aetherivorans TaxID=191292 RepID=UPI00289A2FCD|nr:thiamine pyrophosphate-dependent dehydrogenase E1 component subunit alpha [Rhodococcus aetherivorans]